MPIRRARQRIEELLEALRLGLALDVAFVGEFSDGRRVFRYVSGRLGSMQIEPGLGDPLDESYCFLIAEGRMPGVIPDATAEPTAQGLAATDEVRSHVGIPIYLASGELFGTVCAASTQIRPDLDERTLDYLRNIVPVIARELEELLEEEESLDRRTATVSRLLDPGVLAIYLQPVVELDTRETVSVEALSRFGTTPYRPPNEWFAEAWNVGLGVQLEMAAAREAIGFLSGLDDHVSLAINISPMALATPEFLDVFSGFPGRLIVEVTEHAAVEDYQKLLSVIEPLTDLGVKLAVDDVGAGYASLSHILELSPDVVKLDLSLTRGIERDVSRQALVAALVTFSDRVDARLVAEGVEEPATRDVLRSLGVRFGQGYLLGEPKPAQEVVGGIGRSLLPYATFGEAAGARSGAPEESGTAAPPSSQP